MIGPFVYTLANGNYIVHENVFCHTVNMLIPDCVSADMRLLIVPFPTYEKTIVEWTDYGFHTIGKCDC